MAALTDSGKIELLRKEFSELKGRMSELRKKGFDINIEDVADMVKGKCTILGNIDSIGVLEQGTEEELHAEIVRQIQAGRKNNNKFIMSLGSPATPATSLERLRLYVDMTHEIGSR